MSQIKADIAIIGAGSGGLSVAAGAVQMGMDVVLIEADQMGGDCLNYGCVPSKALISAARAAINAHGAAHLGITGAAPKIDWGAVQAHVKGTIAAIAPHDSQDRFEGLGVRVLRHHARFTGPKTVQAGPYTVTARRFVVAAGARAAIPPIPGLADMPYHTNETIFDLPKLPDHLIILGGGVIGVELAQAFARLGAVVTVIEAQTLVAPLGQHAADHLRRALRLDGVQIHENAPAQSVSRSADGRIAVSMPDGQIIDGSHLLVATGRRANTQGMGLDLAHVHCDQAGKIIVNSALRSHNRRIYAIGDVTAGPDFTHMAGYQAGLVLRNAALGLPVKMRLDHVPSVVYTDPEIASIGMSADQALAKYGDAVQIITQPFASNDRARAEGATDGELRLILRKSRVLGVQIIGRNAGDLIAPWALMISAKLPLRQMAGMILPYPTRSEVHKSAAGAYFAPKLFANPWLARIVRLVQKVLP